MDKILRKEMFLLRSSGKKEVIVDEQYVLNKYLDLQYAKSQIKEAA
jgi:hypothetical protein